MDDIKVLQERLLRSEEHLKEVKHAVYITAEPDKWDDSKYALHSAKLENYVENHPATLRAKQNVTDHARSIADAYLSTYNVPAAEQ